ncbi:MAG: ferritin-like domain-containing protein [Sporichthyaceae bacterium]
MTQPAHVGTPVPDSDSAGPAPRSRRALFMPAAAVAAGATVLATAGRASAASTEDDISALQTAASLENLAVGVYTTAASLDFIKSGNKVVVAFIDMTIKQHKATAAEFNKAIKKAGGKEQNKANPKYEAVVKDALPTIKGPLDVVGLAITLEDVTAQTYTKNVTLVSTPELRTLFTSVAAPAAQRKATLLAVQALLKGDAADLIAIPTKVAKLPEAAGSVGFPDAFYQTGMASPIEEGAVK